MLTIRAAQLETLGLASRARFESELSALFIDAYPRETRQAGGDEAMSRWVRAGVAAALSAGYRSERAASRWVLLRLTLGSGFATDPQLPWVPKLLDPFGYPDPDARVDGVLQQTLQYLDETAGHRCCHVVRAMIRIRRLDFSGVTALEERAAIDDACERLRTLYPEKMEYQGFRTTATSVKLMALRARQLGLTTAGGAFLFVVLSFMLGHEFDRDPLHPWAMEILHGAATATVSPAELARQLEAAARSHLAMSLMDT